MYDLMKEVVAKAYAQHERQKEDILRYCMKVHGEKIGKELQLKDIVCHKYEDRDVFFFGFQPLCRFFHAKIVGGDLPNEVKLSTNFDCMVCDDNEALAYIQEKPA